jgi:hypothetical protein
VKQIRTRGFELFGGGGGGGGGEVCVGGRRSDVRGVKYECNILRTAEGIRMSQVGT